MVFKRNISFVNVVFLLNVSNVFIVFEYNHRVSNFDNTWIYNLIFVPQITRFLLENAIISSLRKGALTRRKVMAKLEITKQCQRSFYLFQLLKQEINILWCFSILKFEKNLCSNKLFRYLFRSERKICTAKNDQIKYFVQN